MEDYMERQIDVAIDLLNSFDPFLEDPEHLKSPEDVLALLLRHGFASDEQPNEDHLTAARRLRAELREVVEVVDDAEASRRLGALLSGVSVEPGVLVDADGGWQVALRPASGLALADQLAAAAVLGLAAAYQRHGRDRIHVCDADPCQDVFIDLSRNRSRRFCSDRCANRHNVAAFRQRARGRE